MNYKLHLPYANRPDLLRGAVESVRDIGNIHIWGTDVEDPHIPDATFHDLPPVPFSTSLNMIFQNAIESGDDVAFFMHTDGWAAPGAAKRFRGFVEHAFVQSRDWGVIFTHFDVLCAFRVEAIKETGYFDPVFAWYMSDCDYYHRLRQRFRQIDAGGDDIAHGAHRLPADGETKTGNGSQTVRSDRLISALVGFRNTTGFDGKYYAFKWGGGVGQERLATAFGV